MFGTRLHYLLGADCCCSLARASVWKSKELPTFFCSSGSNKLTPAGDGITSAVGDEMQKPQKHTVREVRPGSKKIRPAGDGITSAVGDEMQKPQRHTVSEVGSKKKRPAGDCKPISVLHSVRATDKYFFGPLLETKREKLKHVKNKKRVADITNVLTNKETATKNSKKSNKLKCFDFKQYEKFASLYSESSKGALVKDGINSRVERMNFKNENMNVKSNIHKKRCVVVQQISETPLDMSGSSNSASNLQLFSSSIENDKTQNLTTQVEKLNLFDNSSDESNGSYSCIFQQHSPDINVNFVEISNLEYTDVPRHVDFTAMKDFPLYNIANKTDLINVPFTLKNSNLLNSSANFGHNVETQNNINGGSVSQFVNSSNLYVENDELSKISSCESSNITTVAYNSTGKKNLPSVSKIINDTMPEASKLALAKWEAKMVAQMGLKKFQEYKKELFSKGSLLHKCIHTYLQHSMPPSPSDLEQLGGHWCSIEEVVREVRGMGQQEEVAVLESRVVHPFLHYAGVVDCVAQYRNTPVIVEWKTSTKPKPSLQSTYDNPVQLVAYLGALQHDLRYRYLQQVQCGLLAFSYGSGSSGHVHLLTPALLQRFWQQWLNRLELFWRLRALHTDPQKR